MPLILPGLTFPQLASPPGGTALGGVSGGYLFLGVGPAELLAVTVGTETATLSPPTVDPNSPGGAFYGFYSYVDPDNANYGYAEIGYGLVNPNASSKAKWIYSIDMQGTYADNNSVSGQNLGIYDEINQHYNFGVGPSVVSLDSAHPFVWSSTTDAFGTPDAGIKRLASASLAITDGSSGGGSLTALDFIWTGTKATNLVLAGPATGSAAAPGYRALVAADLPLAAADGTTKGIAAFTAADFNATTGVVSLDYMNGQKASGSQPGFLSATDWSTFNGKGSGTVTGITTTSPISGGTITGTGTISLLVNTDFAFTAGQTITAPAGATALTLAGGTQTSNFPVISATQTWNASATSFVAFRINATVTAAASGSLLFDVGTGGGSYSSQFSVRKDGYTTWGTTGAFYPNGGNTQFGAGTQDFTGIASSGIKTVQFIAFGASGSYGWASATNTSPDIFLVRAGAAILQHGQDVNGAAVSQIIQAANGITGTDKTGGNLTNRSGVGTGAGAISAYIVQSPTLGTTGTTPQTQATRLTIDQTSARLTVPLAFTNLAVSNAVPTIASGFGSGATIAGIVGGFRITVGSVPGVGGTVNFNTTFANAPVCFVQDETTGVLGIAAPTTTTVVISGLTLVAGQTVCVFCFGY